MKSIKGIWNTIKSFFVAIYMHRKESHLFWQDYIVQSFLLALFFVIIQNWIAMIVIMSIQQLYSFIKAIQQVRQLKKEAGKE